MAIRIKEKEREGGDVSIEISNRHLEKLREVTSIYGMKGEAYTLAFLLDIAEESKGVGFTIHGRLYVPSEEMKYGRQTVKATK